MYKGPEVSKCGILEGQNERVRISRQVSEAVALGNAKVGTIINTKKEWNYVQLPKVVVDNGEYSD